MKVTTDRFAQTNDGLSSLINFVPGSKGIDSQTVQNIVYMNLAVCVSLGAFYVFSTLLQKKIV